MATILDLNAENRNRTGTGAVGRLRKEGSIPAVLYGRGRENLNLKLDGRTFNRILENSASDNILVSLKIGGESGNHLALVQEVQHDHLKGGILHVDFHEVKENEEIHANVPVDLVGTPIGIKMGGVLEYIHHSLHVRCLPKDLPDRITVDVSHLNLNESVHVREIKLPAGVTTRLDGEVVIAMVAEPKVEAEPEPTPAAAAPAAGAAAPAAGAAPAADKAKK
jgi:large subunit ribosomal protein L25